MVRNWLSVLCKQLTLFVFSSSCAWPLVLPRQQLRFVLPDQPSPTSFPSSPAVTAAFLRCHLTLLQLALLILSGCSFAVNTLIVKLLWVRPPCTNNELEYEPWSTKNDCWTSVNQQLRSICFDSYQWLCNIRCYFVPVKELHQFSIVFQLVSVSMISNYSAFLVGTSCFPVWILLQLTPPPKKKKKCNWVN